MKGDSGPLKKLQKCFRDSVISGDSRSTVFYFTLLVLSCPVPFSSLVVFSLFSRLDSSHSYVPYVNLPMTSPPTISKHPAPSDNHSASSNSPSNMSSQKIPSQQQGNQEQPQRSRNARAQARHRAKRKAYIEQVRSLSLYTPLPLFPPRTDPFPIHPSRFG